MRIKNVHGAPILLIVITALLIGLNFVDVSFLAIDDSGYLSMIVLQILVLGLPAVFYVRLRGKKFITHLRLRFVKAYDIPFLIYATLLMVFGGVIISFFMYRFFPDAFASSSPYNLTEAAGSSVGTGLYAAIAAGIVPAVTEEFLFRGVIVTEYERNGVPLAIFMSSLTFALMHLSFVRFPVYFFSGLVLALVLYATRSAVAAMIVHAAGNIFAMFSEVYIYRAAVRQGGGIVMFVFICVTAFLLSAVLFCGAAQKEYTAKAYDNVSSEHTRRKKRGELPYAAEAVLSPAFIVLVIVSIAGTLLCR